MVLMLPARIHCLALFPEILSSATAFLMAISEREKEERHFYLAILKIRWSWKIALLLTIKLLKIKQELEVLEALSARAIRI
jgi:uncharacterized membrane protein